MKKVMLSLVLGSLISFNAIADAEKNEVVDNGQKEDKISVIIEEIKQKNLTVDDFVQYGNTIKDKMNESMVGYFNEIDASLELLKENTKDLNIQMDKKIDDLKSKISKSINDFNKNTDQEELRKNFEDISKSYIEIMKEYKLKLEEKIKDQNAVKVDDKK